MDLNTIVILDYQVYKIRNQTVKLDFDIAEELDIDIKELRNSIDNNKDYFDFDSLDLQDVCEEKLNNISNDTMLAPEHIINKLLDVDIFQLNKEEYSKLKQQNQEEIIYYSPNLEEHSSEILPYVITTRGYIRLKCLLDDFREPNKYELFLLMLSEYDKEKIIIHKNKENGIEYVLYDEIQTRRYNLTPYLNSTPKKKNIELNIIGFLKNLESISYSVEDLHAQIDYIIQDIENRILFSSIDREKQEVYFIRLISQISFTYNYLIQILKDNTSFFNEDSSIKDLRKMEENILCALTFLYDFSDQVKTIANQLNIDLIAKSQENGIGYIFKENNRENDLTSVMKLDDKIESFIQAIQRIKHTEMNETILDKNETALFFKHLRIRKFVNMDIADKTYAQIIHYLTGYSPNTIRTDLGKNPPELTLEKIETIIKNLKDLIVSIEKEKSGMINKK